ncbi:XdhC family protein [Deltaproteobacteria bacterium]|nr:XdhC family protein [Deltaproteobacteria bacterium]
MNHMENPVEIALKWDDERREVALATVIATWGSSPLPVGSQLVADATGAFEGSVSGGCIEGAVITEAMEVIREGQAKRLFFGVSNEQAWEVGLACGGEIEVYVEKLGPNRALYEDVKTLRIAQRSFCIITDLESDDKILARMDDPESIEGLDSGLRHEVSEAFHRESSTAVRMENGTYFIQVFNPNPQLIIVGAVHIAGPLARMARLTDYSVVIIDPRATFASEERFPDTELKVEWPDEAMAKMSLHSRTAVVALTHDPKLDDPALKTALQSNVFYIGALGSRKTHASRRDRLKMEGFKEDQLRRIHGPVGLDINARTPAEIAVAILAEITAERRKMNLSDISRKTANGL